MNKNEDISPAQTKSLAALWDAGGACSDWRDAYKTAGVDGRTVPTLVRRGLVRLYHPENRLNWRLEMTPAGVSYLITRAIRAY